MRKHTLFFIFIGALCWTGAASAQDDSPSLGDVARQARQQKQQKDAPAAKEDRASAPTPDGSQTAGAANAQPAKPPKRIITNDEIPEHVGPTRAADQLQTSANYPQKNNDQMAGEQLKAQILQVKSSIASMQSQIAELEQSIHYTGGNCVSGCAQWNENQQKKQEQLETMKQQLAQKQEGLEHEQEIARKMGYGSAVYDP